MKDFREFLLRGNVVDLAVGIVIGAAFGALVTAFVGAFITPIVALVAGKADVSSLAFTVGGNGTPASPGTTFPYGIFLTAVISFVLVAFAVYFMVVKPINALRERRGAASRSTRRRSRAPSASARSRRRPAGAPTARRSSRLPPRRGLLLGSGAA